MPPPSSTPSPGTPSAPEREAGLRDCGAGADSPGPPAIPSPAVVAVRIVAEVEVRTPVGAVERRQRRRQRLLRRHCKLVSIPSSKITMRTTLTIDDDVLALAHVIGRARRVLGTGLWPISQAWPCLGGSPRGEDRLSGDGCQLGCRTSPQFLDLCAERSEQFARRGSLGPVRAPAWQRFEGGTAAVAEHHDRGEQQARVAGHQKGRFAMDRFGVP